MNLLEAIFALEQMPDESCICCKRPFHQSSEAKIVPLTPEGDFYPGALDGGFEYFLEKEVVGFLLADAEGKLKSREAKTELLLTMRSSTLPLHGSMTCARTKGRFAVIQPGWVTPGACNGSRAAHYAR